MTRMFTALALVVGLASTTRAQTMTGSPDQVVGSVAGQSITMRELEAHWDAVDQSARERLRQQVYEAQRAVLDDLIGARLIELEAKKRGLSVPDLLERELPSRAPEVTEDVARQFYEQNRERTGGKPFEELKSAILTFLAQQRPVLARRRLVDDLRKAAPDISIALDPPRRAVSVATTDPVTGPSSAPVEIVEFSDFQCPFCKRVTPILKGLRATFGDQVRLVFKDFPLDIHPQAVGAAQAAQCARAQGKFWEYHDVLFGRQEALFAPDLKRYARELGLDGAEFDRCVDERRFESLVNADIEEGEKFGLTSTPTVFINGRTVTGAAPAEVYEAIVREELAKARPR